MYPAPFPAGCSPINFTRKELISGQFNMILRYQEATMVSTSQLPKEPDSLPIEYVHALADLTHAIASLTTYLGRS